MGYWLRGKDDGGVGSVRRTAVREPPIKLIIANGNFRKYYLGCIDLRIHAVLDRENKKKYYLDLGLKFMNVIMMI